MKQTYKYILMEPGLLALENEIQYISCSTSILRFWWSPPHQSANHHFGVKIRLRYSLCESILQGHYYSNMCLALPAICGQPVEPSTPCANRSKIALQVMNAFTLVIMISAFVVGDMVNGLVNIFFIPILFCAWRFLQHSIISIYMFFCLILFFTSLASLLQLAQSNTYPFPGETKSAWSVFQIIYCTYYLAAFILCFYIYREFKAISFEKNPAIHRYFQARNNAANETAEEPSGIALDNNFAPTYGQRQHARPANNQNRNRGQMVEVFQGRGVVIGGN